MIIISDTTPIHYLVLIDQIDVLAILYDRVLIPSAVFRELQAKETPQKVKDWLMNLPDWLEVKTLTHPADISLGNLDAGEREAIQLAEELNLSQIIIDERIGRQIAEERGLDVIGTLGILIDASVVGVTDILTALEKLQKTNFYISQKMLQLVLDKANARKEQAKLALKKSENEG